MVRKKVATDDDDETPDPELTRCGDPELTRCDHCGKLDATTQPTTLFAAEAGDGWHWLHPNCAREFVPPQCHPLADHRGRLVGVRVQLPEEETPSTYVFNGAARATGMLYRRPESAPRCPPPGWLRSRFARSTR